MLSIVFSDINLSIATDKDSYDFLRIYHFNTNLFTRYTNDIKLSIGDVIIGTNILIFIVYEDIDIPISPYNWVPYISNMIELLDIKDILVKVYLYNSSRVIPYTSVKTQYSYINNITKELSNKFRKIEIC